MTAEAPATCRCKHLAIAHRNSAELCTVEGCSCNLFTPTTIVVVPEAEPTHLAKADQLHQLVSKDPRLSLDVQKPALGKPRPTLVDPEFIEAMAKVMESGLKHGRMPDDWKNLKSEDVLCLYPDAMFRHLLQVVRDPYSVDKESAELAVMSVAANAMILHWHITRSKKPTEEQ
jgi:hypothetical protein